MSLTLQVKLLGELSITYGDRAVTEINTARSQSLLAYLILHRQSPQPRQRLAFHLWENSTETQARTNLRKELSYLRRDLPQADQFLLVESKTLHWSPTAPFTSDVIEFETTLQAAEAAEPKTKQVLLKQAIALYTGDLLPSCEDEWIVPERERLQRLYSNALEQLIECLQTRQDYRQALNHAQQLLRLDPLNEATYCTLMRLYNLSGDRANALQVYHRCMSVLCEELGVDPSSTTRKLYEQLLLEDEFPTGKTATQSPLRQRLSPPPQLTPPNFKGVPLPLIGRKREWSLMHEWVNTDTRDASSQLLLLVGEPGIGKTRLLEELRATVPIALWGRGFAAEMVRPYGIWIDALRSVTLPAAVPPELGFLLPEVGQPISAPPDRGHLFDAVVQLLAAWAAKSPLVVMLDDIQWIDEASSALLHYASRLLSHLPIKFACTVRSVELFENKAISQMVQVLRREHRLKTVELEPFDRGRTAELIRSVNAGQLFDLSLEIVDQVFTDSGGNPLFVLEIARALAAHTPPQNADNLEMLIRDRLQKLDDAARDFLLWAAALGRSFKPTTVAQVAGYPLTQLLAVIDQLEQQNIIRPSTSVANEKGYDFAHDIVRQVVYQQISEPRRQLVHLQIAHQLNQRLIQDNALAADVAHHASVGGDHELAASSALSAAERCLKLFAYAEAAKLAQQGIQHCQHLNHAARLRLHLGLLRVCAIAGVVGDRATQLETEIQQLLQEARRLGLKDDEAIGLEILGILYFNQSNFTEMHPHLLRSIEVSRATSSANAARFIASTASCLAEIGRDMVRAEALLLEAQSLAARVGLELPDIYSGLGSIHLHNGHCDEARPLLLRAWELAQSEQDHWRGCTYLTYLAMTELEAGNPTEALPYCKKIATVAAKIQSEGSEGAIAAALSALANYQLQQSGADVVLEQAIIALQHVDAKRLLSYVLISAAEIDLERHCPQLAAGRAETALQAAQAVNHPSEIALAWAILVQGLLALGNREQAIAQFQLLHNQIERHTLSMRARIEVDCVIQQMQRLATTSHHFSKKR